MFKNLILVVALILMSQLQCFANSETHYSGRFWVIPLGKNILLSAKHCYDHSITNGYKDSPILVGAEGHRYGHHKWVELAPVVVGQNVYSPINGWGKVIHSRFDGKIHTTHRSKHGDSGSGLYDTNGRLVGVLCGFFPNKENSIYLGPAALADYIEKSGFANNPDVVKFMKYYKTKKVVYKATIGDKHYNVTATTRQEAWLKLYQYRDNNKIPDYLSVGIPLDQHDGR